MSAFTGQAAEDKKALQAPCVEDAMIVFDASAMGGAMAASPPAA